MALEEINQLSTNPVHNTSMNKGRTAASIEEQHIDTRKAALLAYTNIEEGIEEPADWRHGINTRNQSAKHFSADKPMTSTDITQTSPGKFVDSVTLKRPE